MTEAARQCSSCIAESFEARDPKSHRVPVCRNDCPPEPRPALVPSSRFELMPPSLYLSDAAGNVPMLQHFFFAFRLPCATQFELPRAFAYGLSLCRLSILDNSGHLISSQCTLVVGRLPATLVAHLSMGHSQGWDLICMTQVVSVPIPFGNCAAMEMSFDSPHSFHPDSSHFGCTTSNWRDWDWLSLSVLRLHLDAVMLPPMEALVPEQLA